MDQKSPVLSLPSEPRGFGFYVDGAWVESVTVTLWPWDSGSDSGTTWTADNQETQPRESIRLSTAPYFLYEDGLRPLGTATFVRIE